MSPLLVTVLGFVLLLPTAFGFTWDYPVAARQCSTFTVVVNGSDVVLPLKVLLVPVGPSPLPVEVRKVVEIPFPTSSLNVSFQLPYPTNSKFVGLVSDASGYRGTASTWTVLSSTDASCFDATKDAVPTFTFALSPTDVAECRDVRIYWTAANVQGTPSFLSVIPDGAFGAISLGKIDAQTGLGTGFTWRPPVRASSNLIIVGGDLRGTGAGGFISTIVSPGNPSRDASENCPALAASTTSTPVIVPTLVSISSPLSSATGSAVPIVASSPNVGAVVGGVLGGVAALGFLFLIFFFLLRKRKPAVAPVMQHQYPPNVPSPAYYAGPGPYGPMVPPQQIPSPQPGWGVVPQEPPGQLPMQIAYTGQSATTGFTTNSWKGSPAQATNHWSASNDNVMRPTSWDGRG